MNKQLLYSIQNIVIIKNLQSITH